MARAKNNGNGRLDEAFAALTNAQANLVQAQANLVQNQSALAQEQTALLARIAEIDARWAKLEAEKIETNRINSERFARIEGILLEHSRILHELPDAVRDKIGFKSPQPGSSD